MDIQLQQILVDTLRSYDFFTQTGRDFTQASFWDVFLCICVLKLIFKNQYYYYVLLLYDYGNKQP